MASTARKRDNAGRFQRRDDHREEAMTTTNRMNFASGAGLSRRALLAGAGATGLALAGGRRVFAAGAENTLKVGFISPRTGALGGFGQTDGYVLDVVRKSLASGFAVGDKTFDVKILDQDTQSDPSRAGQLAKGLINSDKIDMMLVVSTPETINPVADACEAAGVPCLSTVMPWEAWYFGRGAKPGAPSPFKWTYHFGFGVEEFHKTYVSQWNLIPTNKKVGVLYPNDADGNAIRAQGRLHHRRRRPLRRRHHRLFGANRHVQEGEVRNLQLLPDPAGFRRLLAPGGAAGLYEDGQDQPDRQDRPLPRRYRGARQSRLQHLQRRLLAQGVPL
jgi:hypothetical protein